MSTCYNVTGDLNLLLPRHEDQDVSHGRLQVDLHSLLNSTLHVVLTGVPGIHDVHRESAAWDLENRASTSEDKELCI